MNPGRAVLLLSAAVWVACSLIGCGPSKERRAQAELARAALLEIVRQSPKSFGNWVSITELEQASLEWVDTTTAHLGRFTLALADLQYSVVLGPPGSRCAYQGTFRVQTDQRWSAKPQPPVAAGGGFHEDDNAACPINEPVLQEGPSN
jgi:hypothetical protein